MKKFPSIERFRNIVTLVQLQHDYTGRDENNDPVYVHTTPYPTLTFVGTVKLHGVNAAVVKYKDEHIEFQSRETVLTREQDCEGFVRLMQEKPFEALFENIEFRDYVAIYGEWCGQGVQSGVAISQLPKMFVIFAIKVDDKWMQVPRTLHNHEHQIYNIFEFDTYTATIDFNTPEASLSLLTDLTISVEQECPVGLALGVKGTGEGIVWTCITNSEYRFKSKGEKHSVSKEKTVVNIAPEMLAGIQEFVESTVTENRLKQGISVLKEKGLSVENKYTGDFIRWVVEDVFKEESDTILANAFDEKKVKNEIAAKARKWFLDSLL